MANKAKTLWRSAIGEGFCDFLRLFCDFLETLLKKTVQRLLVFFLGIPMVLAMVMVTNFHHLALNIVLCLASVLSAKELCELFDDGEKRLNKGLLCILSLCVPLSAYIFVTFEKNIDYTSIVFFVCAMLIMTGEVFCAKSYTLSNKRICASVFIIFYCGFFCTFITRMTLLSGAVAKICLFFVIVFISDSAAWLFGVLFGKNNRNVVKASPNKSIAGFIGGLIGSVACCVLALLIFKEQFSAEVGSALCKLLNKIAPSSSIESLGAIESTKSALGGGGINPLVVRVIKAVILAFVCNVASVVGDLVESVFKRSAGTKDSGALIPGRGGILDCVDSVFFTAPVFYVMARLLFL